MTFKEYRNDCNWNDKLSLQIQKGKDLIKQVYTVSDFDENERYEIDDYIVIQHEENYGLGIMYLKLKEA